MLVTFDCIVDQYGLMLHHDITTDGLTKLDIKSFPTDAADTLTKGKKEKKNDHLNSHVGLAQSCDGPWELELTPLFHPDTNVAESLFHRFKAYLRNSML